jgi:hypothetical protein
MGPGMLWKKMIMSVNFAPAAAKLIVVDGHFTELAPSFGVCKETQLVLNLEPVLLHITSLI